MAHNEAIRSIDALVQFAVAGSDTVVSPADPAESHRHIVGAGATGDWSGHENEIAAFQDGAWAFRAPKSGRIAWNVPNSVLLVWTGTEWSKAGAGFVNPAALVGVNTLADAANRLAVKAVSVLLSHDDMTPDSGDMPDGANWNETLVLDPATGCCGFGTTSPLGGMFLERKTGQLAAFVLDDASAAPGNSGASMFRYRKPAAADDRLGYLIFGSKGGGAATYNPAGIQGPAEAAWTAGVSQPAYLEHPDHGAWHDDAHGTLALGMRRTLPSGS